MHGDVAARTPATAQSQVSRVIALADENRACWRVRSWNLRVTFEAKIVVTLHQHLRVDRTMRLMANRASFAQRFVLEYKWPRLFTMTLGARFVQPRHHQTARGFVNVQPVRIVALHAIHLPFANGMMLWQINFRVRLQMALQTRCRIAPRIYDESSSPATSRDVLAPGPMTRFATTLAGHFRLLEMHPRVRARGKNAHDIRMAFEAGLVADKCRAFDVRRHDYSSLNTGAGNQ